MTRTDAPSHPPEVPADATVGQDPPEGGFPTALVAPLLSAAGLGAYLLVPGVRAHPVLFPTFLAVVGIILGWTAWVWLSARQADEALTLKVAIRKPHYIQLVAQGSVLVYWGWWVRSVYDFSPLILAQILVAVAMDALLNLHRRRHWNLGVGAVPVVFSINLFLWFTVPYFYFQFLMIPVVYLGKEFLRREWNGRNTHVFNPSAFALAVAAVLLIVTGSTDITQGVAIADTQNIPPFIYVAIFAAALPGQWFFGVATMTMTAVITMCVFGEVWLQTTGAYFFYDAYVPIAVFLGMHLLFTDPATSPRTEGGRVLWGILYAAGVLGSVPLLEAAGAPTFYDKLLPVPLLNLIAPHMDAAALAVIARVKALEPLEIRADARRAKVTTGIWIAVFAGFTAVGWLGDDHPGQYLPYWEEACAAGNGRACDYLPVMQQNYCDRGSGWACNEFGVFRARYDGDLQGAMGEFERACTRGSEAGCANRARLLAGEALIQEEPPLEELPILLRGSKGPVTETHPQALYALGCERGWDELCARAGTAPPGG